MAISIMSVAGRPKDVLVGNLILQIMREVDPPMANISRIQAALLTKTGRKVSWNTVANHLGDLERAGVVKKLVYSKSVPYIATYKKGRKLGKTESRVRETAFYQLAETFRPVVGMEWK